MDRLWLINPDAEQELAAFSEETKAASQGRSVTHKQFSLIKDRFLPLTAGESCQLISEFSQPSPSPLAEGTQLVPWCPTANLKRVVEKYLGRSVCFPPMSLLQMLNDKSQLNRWPDFVAEGRTLITHSEQLLDLIHSQRWCSYDSQQRDVGSGGRPTVRMKRRFGQAGRGQWRVNEYLSPLDRRFIHDGLKHGALVVEPELDAVGHYSLHGVVAPGETYLGYLCTLETDRFSAPTRVSVLRALSHKDEQRHERASQIVTGVSSTMRELGYLGPFGIDFVETKEDQLIMVDLNVRFTLGWSTGLADRRLAALKLLPDYLNLSSFPAAPH